MKTLALGIGIAMLTNGSWSNNCRGSDALAVVPPLPGKAITGMDLVSDHTGAVHIAFCRTEEMSDGRKHSILYHKVLANGRWSQEEVVEREVTGLPRLVATSKSLHLMLAPNPPRGKKSELRRFESSLPGGNWHEVEPIEGAIGSRIVAANSACFRDTVLVVYLAQFVSWVDAPHNRNGKDELSLEVYVFPAATSHFVLDRFPLPRWPQPDPELLMRGSSFWIAAGVNHVTQDVVSPIVSCFSGSTADPTTWTTHEPFQFRQEQLLAGRRDTGPALEMVDLVTNADHLVILLPTRAGLYAARSEAPLPSKLTWGPRFLLFDGKSVGSKGLPDVDEVESIASQGQEWIAWIDKRNADVRFLEALIAFLRTGDTSFSPTDDDSDVFVSRLPVDLRAFGSTARRASRLTGDSTRSHCLRMTQTSDRIWLAWIQAPVSGTYHSQKPSGIYVWSTAK